MEQTRLRYTPKDQPVSCQRVDRTSDYTPRFIHMHASHELCFVSGKSQFEVFSGGRTAAVQAPALIFHRNHCYHELLRILPGTIYYSTVAHFLPETLPLPTALQAWDCVILPLSAQEEENFSRYFTLLPNEPTERQVLVIQLILSRFLEQLRTPGTVFLKAVSSYIIDLLHHISEHPEEKATIDTLASRYHVSPTKLKQDFSAFTGTSIGKFLIHQRLMLARSLLHSDIPLGQLALQCGFSSQSHFIAAFRNHYGMTPGAYKKGGNHHV